MDKKERAEYNKNYHLKNKDVILKRKREISQTSKEKEAHRIRSSSYYYRHKQRVLDRNLKRLKECKELTFNHYGNKCMCCKDKHKEFLCIDHINDDGAKHRKSLGITGGYYFYKWLVLNNFPAEFQILCWNCNSAKHIYGKCPHQSKGN